VRRASLVEEVEHSSCCLRAHIVHLIGKIRQGSDGTGMLNRQVYTINKVTPEVGRTKSSKISADQSTIKIVSSSCRTRDEIQAQINTIISHIGSMTHIK
jgi:hypothetical protein